MWILKIWIHIIWIRLPPLRPTAARAPAPKMPEAAAAGSAALKRPKTTRGLGQRIRRPRRPLLLEVQSGQGRTSQPSSRPCGKKGGSRRPEGSLRRARGSWIADSHLPVHVLGHSIPRAWMMFCFGERSIVLRSLCLCWTELRNFDIA